MSAIKWALGVIAPAPFNHAHTSPSLGEAEKGMNKGRSFGRAQLRISHMIHPGPSGGGPADVVMVDKVNQAGDLVILFKNNRLRDIRISELDPQIFLVPDQGQRVFLLMLLIPVQELEAGVEVLWPVLPDQMVIFR